ncbi:hypothetical protein RB195_024752 [Necator americanus]|uniref:Uncharacterized protein n=1 Tax=Necator americanus TaxID=51031 RepID=A0ABR1EPI5_NECAM
MQLVFQNFEAAFDPPHRGRLHNALRTDGVPGKFVRLIVDMLTTVRTQAGCTTPFEVVKGARRGNFAFRKISSEELRQCVMRTGVHNSTIVNNNSAQSSFRVSVIGYVLISTDALSVLDLGPSLAPVQSVASDMLTKRLIQSIHQNHPHVHMKEAGPWEQVVLVVGSTIMQTQFETVAEAIDFPPLFPQQSSQNEILT